MCKDFILYKNLNEPRIIRIAHTLLPVNIRDGKLNKINMTHDKLYSRNTYMDILKRKLTRPKTSQINKK